MSARESTAIRTAGGMLTASLLARLSRGDSSLGGLKSADFHLPAGQSPREAANRAWTYLSGIWPAFRDAVTALPEDDPAVRVTREQWLLQVFSELGYGRLERTPAGGLAVGDRSYPISHAWRSTPMHLLGWNVPLDRRSKGVAGAAERAPHALVQEFLNRSEHHLWGVVSNGQVLRLLRDSSALSTQTFVEFDLVAIFEGDLFADFVVLFLLLHWSRVAPGASEGGAVDPTQCWLERWREQSATSGTRAMDSLRGGVQEAIELLGTGFLQHPDNVVLRHQLGDREPGEPEVSAADYQRALLRLVYRLLFLFVAEDRDALLDPSAPAAARERYTRFYSTARLRRTSRRRLGTQHSDLWEAQKLVIRRLGDEHGCPELALPGIGGLFDDRGTEFLTAASISNQALLAAVRALSVVQPKGEPRQVVDYKNLGAEELGSIYESLLELVPRLNMAEKTFGLELLAGNERKTTGSYYTPSSLIDLVLDETLTPLLDEAERSADPEAALLGLTVCDPACGSGHFLVAAARRIAERLAVARSGEQDPTPTDIAEAMRDVVARCIYGVDINPLAAELAKVSLWLESMEAGKPLSFLDSHIKVGNSLLGTTPALLAEGVPDAAFAVLEGDDKKANTLLKKQNKADLAQRCATDAGESLFDVFTGDDAQMISNAWMVTRLGEATAVRSRSLTELHAVERRYREYQADPDLARARLHADTWCAAFVQVKGEGLPTITTATVDEAARGDLDRGTRAEVERLQAQYGFFHWHLEFPEIFEVGADTAAEPQGWRGGFAAVVGNPPWERVKLQEQEFFAQRDPNVAAAPKAADRKRLIARLIDSNPDLDREWRRASRIAVATSHLLRKSGRYPLCGVGDVNTYAVFAELFRSSIRYAGRMGIITPTGLATDATTSDFFADTVKHKRLAAFYDFENEARIFPGVHHAYRFAVTSMTGGIPAAESRLAFLIRHVRDAGASRFPLAPDEILMLNPNTGTLPLFRSRKDAEITLKIYRRFPVLINNAEQENPWGLRFVRLLDMANDSGLFQTAEDLEKLGAAHDGWAWRAVEQRWLPLYEAKMLSHYDHRFSTYEGATQAQLNVGTLPRLTDEDHADPTKEPRPRYWVAENEVEKAIGDRWDRGWFLGWRDIARASDTRTFIPSVLPRSAVGHPFPLCLSLDPDHAPCLQAVFSSLVFDYVARQKLSGTHMTYGVVGQLACPPPSAFDAPLPGVCEGPLSEWIKPRVLELTYTSNRMAPYAKDILDLSEDEDPDPPFPWDPARRAHLQAELDAAMFRLYGLTEEEAELVLEGFPAARKYEERDFGSFETKVRVLEFLEE